MPKSLHDIECPEEVTAEPLIVGSTRIDTGDIWRPFAPRPDWPTPRAREEATARQRAVLANDNVGIMLEFAVGRAMDQCLTAYRANPTNDEYGTMVVVTVDGVEKAIRVKLRITDYERLVGYNAEI